MACTRRHTTTPFIKIFRESESVGQIPDPSTFFSPATGWKRERGEKETREENGVQDVVAQYTYMFRLGGLNFVASGWITTRSNRIADRLIGTVAVSWFPEAKRSISRSGETRWTRATRCTIHGGKNKIWNGVCFNFQDRTCWLDLRFDSRQWLRLDIIVRFNFQRVTPSNYDRYIYREREWQAWYMCYICVCVYSSGESIKIIQRKYIII